MELGGWIALLRRALTVIDRTLIEVRRQNGWGVVQIAASWDRVERIIARVEAGPPRTLYQNIYSARGQLRFTSRCGRPISRPTAPRARGLVGNAKYGVACTNLKIWHISPVFAA